MFKSKYFEGKEFSTKEDLFRSFKENEREIMRIKKSTFKECANCITPRLESEVIAKSVVEKVEDTGKVTKTFIGNTYNWLDNHEDMHVDNCFSKSIKENAPTNFYHYHDHINKVIAKVGVFQSVYENKIDWSSLGINKEGMTMALFAKSEIVKDLNPSIYYQYNNGLINQHSVGMLYVQLVYCFNSTETEFKQEYSNWNKYYGRLGNPDRADELGYFFAVTEAKLIEISAVTKGSNELTGMADELDTKGLDGEELENEVENSNVNTQTEPVVTTPNEPTKSIIEYIRETQFIKI